MKTLSKTHLWIIFIVSCLLIVGSIVVILDRNAKQATETRGWELATRDEAMPFRIPLAGVNVELTQYDPDELSSQLDDIASLGFVWLRQPIYWEQIESEQGDYDWSAYDPIIEAVNAYTQLKLVLVLDGTPAWARHELAPEHPFAPPASVDQFGDFARAVADRYGDSVDYYQIWDEPNLRSHWGNTDPRPEWYVAMLQSAYRAIHGTDESATVISAALAPTVEQGPENYNDIDYLRAIYELGGQDAFDAAAAKPYGYNADPYDRTVDNSTFNFSRIILLREEMVAHGDGDKPLWGSNFGWNHLSDDWTGPPSIWGQTSAQDQIRFTRDAYQRAATEWPWLGGLILQHWQLDAPADDPIQGFAIAPNLAAWQADGSLFQESALISGLYPARNAFTTYVGEWQYGPLGADALPITASRPDASIYENTVTIEFYGTELALLVRRYDTITGYYILTVDGQNANELPQNRQGESQIVLKSVKDEPTMDLVLVASGLENSSHTAVIHHRPRQGDDAWSLAGIAVGTAPDISSFQRLRLIAYILGTIGVIGALFTIFRLPWGQIELPSRQFINNLIDAGTALLFSAIFTLGTALTWDDTFTNFLKRDPPALLITLTTVSLAYFSPVTLLTLLALVIFGIIVFNRPVMGLISVIFWSMFYASTIEAYVRLITVVEAMLVITAAAIFGRLLFESVKFVRQNDMGTRAYIRQLLRQAYEKSLSLYALDLGMLAIVGLSVVSLSWSDLQFEAVHALRVIILGPALFYVLLRNVKLTKSELVLLTDTLIIGGTLIAVLGLRNFFTGDVILADDGARRLIAVYESPNAVALQLGKCLPFALAYVILPLSDWRRGFGGMCSVLMLVALVLTQSLGALLFGIPAMAAVMLLGWQGKRARLWLVGLGLGGVISLFPLSRLIPRLRTALEGNNSTLFRLNVWRSTIELLKDHPITGVGLDQFLYIYRSRYIVPEGSADPDLSHPHNFILDYWVFLGIMGVVVGLWLQVAFWRTLWSTYRRVRDADPILFALVLGMMGMMGNFIGHGMVDVSFFFINLSFLFSLVVAMLIRTHQFATDDS